MANERILDSKIQIRNDTAANWKAANPVLLKGELGIEIDTRKLKIGDGISTWTGLKYVSDNVLVENTNPTASDTDHDVGVIWLNQSEKTVYILIATSSTAAVWKRLVSGDEVTIVAEAQVAQKLKTARAISLTGDVTGATTFDGSEDVAITVVLKNTGASEGTFTKVTVNEKRSYHEDRTAHRRRYPRTDACQDYGRRNGGGKERRYGGGQSCGSWGRRKNQRDAVAQDCNHGYPRGSGRGRDACADRRKG